MNIRPVRLRADIDSRTHTTSGSISTMRRCLSLRCPQYGDPTANSLLNLPGCPVTALADVSR